MTRAGLSDEVIVQHLRSHGLTGQLSASDLITLKEQGVSDRVLQAMQEIGSAAYRAPPPRRQPVIVEEHYYDVHPDWGPDCWYPRHHHHHLRARHSRHNLHWGFSFSD